MTPETKSEPRSVAAGICEISDVQLRNLINREGLFASRRSYSGRRLAFTIREMMQISAVRLLTELGWPTPAAVSAIEPVSVFAALLEQGYIQLGWSVEQMLWRSSIVDPSQPTMIIPLWPIYDRIIENWNVDGDLEWQEYLKELDNLRQEQG